MEWPEQSPDSIKMVLGEQDRRKKMLVVCCTIVSVKSGQTIKSKLLF